VDGALPQTPGFSEGMAETRIAVVLVVKSQIVIGKRPKIVLVGFLARCAKMADGGVYAAFGSASASATVFR